MITRIYVEKFGKSQILVHGQRPFGEGPTEMVLNCSEEQFQKGWINWAIKGHMIQDALPFLDATEREFLITGMDEKEQTEFYRED